jgi:hypothetical protein
MNETALIKDVVFDIISVITIWGLFNNFNFHVRINNKICPIYANFIGIGMSAYMLRKYSV